MKLKGTAARVRSFVHSVRIYSFSFFFPANPVGTADSRYGIYGNSRGVLLNRLSCNLWSFRNGRESLKRTSPLFQIESRLNNVLSNNGIFLTKIAKKINSYTFHRGRWFHRQITALFRFPCVLETRGFDKQRGSTHRSTVFISMTMLPSVKTTGNPDGNPNVARMILPVQRWLTGAPCPHFPGR